MTPTPSRESLLESLALPLGILMLVVWAAVTFTITAPGWIHGLLVLGTFAVIWGIVARDTPPPTRR